MYNIPTKVKTFLDPIKNEVMSIEECTKEQLLHCIAELENHIPGHIFVSREADIKAGEADKVVVQQQTAAEEVKVEPVVQEETNTSSGTVMSATSGTSKE